MCVCVRACVRACVCAWVRACVCVCGGGGGGWGGVLSVTHKHTDTPDSYRERERINEIFVSTNQSKTSGHN